MPTSSEARAGAPVLHRAARGAARRGLRGSPWYWALARRLQPLPTGLTDIGHGQPLVCDDSDWTARTLYEGTYERAELALLPFLVIPGSAVLDVGANVGTYMSRCSALVGPAGVVLAFEPSALCLPVLRQVAAATARDNIILHPVALGAADGEAHLHLFSSESHSGLATLRDVPTEETVTVPVRRLDDFLPETGGRRISLLKVDVEGFEEKVVAGGRAVLESGQLDHVLLEVSPEFGSVAYAAALVAERGADFAAYAVSERGAVLRRPALVPLGPDDIEQRRKQFNLLLVRRALDHRVRRLVAR